MSKFKPRFLLVATLLFSFTTANFVYAQTSPDTQTLIKQLQEQIKALQTQITNLNSQLEATKKESATTKEELKTTKEDIKTTKEEVKELREEIKITRSLRKGIKGDDVKELQGFLSQFPDIYPSGSITGFFGSSTETAVRKLQQKYGIQALGVVGPKTISKINELLTEGAGKSGVISPGLLTAPGIEKKLATTTESAPFLYSASTTPIAPTPTTSTATTTTSTTTVVSFTVASPNGGEQWTQGGTYNITWTSVGAVPTARISIYDAGSFKEILAADVTNNGLWNWTIPSTMAVGAQYKIRVFNLVYPNNFDDSNNYFSIIAPASASVSQIAPTTSTTTPITTATTTTATSTTATTTAVSFTVYSPNGGEQWTQGSTHNITWTSVGSVPTARISLYEAGNFKEILAADVTNNGLWSWAVPTSITAGTQYKIRVFNLVYPNNFDESDNYFSVVAPSPTPPDPASLISHWKFDGNGVNEIAGRPTAVNVGNATTTTSGGKFGGYAYIPSSGDQIKIPYNSIYDMGDAFSVEFWFRQRSNQSVNQDLVYKGTSPNNYNFKIFRYLWNQYNNGAVIAGHTTVNTGYWTQASNNNEPPHGSWHHVVYTKNSSAQAYYIDGVLISSKDFTQYPEYGGTAKTPAVDIIVGGSAIDTDIDNLKIYNKALSASEVLYTFGSSQALAPQSTEKQLADMLIAVSKLADEVKKLLKK